MKYSAILAVSAGLALPAAASRLAIRQEAAAEGQLVDCSENASCKALEGIQGPCQDQNERNFPKQAECICQSKFFETWIDCRKCIHANQPNTLADYTTKLDNTKRAFCAGTANKSFADYFAEAAPGGQPGSGGQGGAAGQLGNGGKGGAAGPPPSPAAPAVTASTSSGSTSTQGGSGGAAAPVVGSTATQKTTAATATSGAGGASGNNSTSASTTRGAGGAGGSGTSGAPGSRSTTGVLTGAAAPKTAAVGSAVLMAFAGVAMMVL